MKNLKRATVLMACLALLGSVFALGNTARAQSMEPPTILISSPTAGTYSHAYRLSINFSATDEDGVASISAVLDSVNVQSGTTIELMYLSLGTHTLTVTATDTLGNTAVQSVSFLVTTDIATLKTIMSKLYSWGEISGQGTCNSLMQTLNNAEKSAEKGDSHGVANHLRTFVHKIEVLKGKKISDSAAAILIGDANYLIAHP